MKKPEFELGEYIPLVEGRPSAHPGIVVAGIDREAKTITLAEWKAKPKRGRSRQLEHSEQVTLCQWLRLRRVLFFAVPNGARRNPRQAAWLKSEGLVAGAPDIVLVPPAPNDGARHVAIELKRENGGVVSPAQKEMHAAMSVRGWIVLVAHGASHAIEQLEGLGF